MSRASKAQTVQQGVRCPACRAEIRLQSDILQFKPVYLRECEVHREMWRVADAHDRKKVRRIDRQLIRDADDDTKWERVIRVKPKKWTLKVRG